MNAFAPTPFFDSLFSLMSGLGVAGRDKNVGMMHIINLLSRTDLEAAYRSDWIARKIVDRPAKDATREWRSWQTESDDIELLEALEKKHNIQKKLYNGLRLARLYGGAALILGVKQGTTEEELDVERVGKDDLEFVHPVSMYSITAGPAITDIRSPWYGEPSYYSTADQMIPAMVNQIGVNMPPGINIHPSRVVMLRGAEFPDTQSATLGIINPAWGDSVLQTVMDAVKAATQVAQSTATMVNEAKIDIVKIPGMSQQMATQEYRDLLTARFAYANVSKSLINTLMLDTQEEWERINANFSQLPDLLRVYLLIASGAADIPATVMLGQSPAGMSATGESDTRNYYDRIHSDQETDLTPTMAKLDEVLIRSALGKRDPSLFYIWNPLWQMDDLQSAQVNKYKADIFQIDTAAGLIDAEALRIGRQNQLIEDGVYPGLEEALEAQTLLGEESMMTPEEQQKEALGAQEQQLKMQQQYAPKPAAGQQPGQKGKPKLSVVKDATPKPLYVYREVLNYKDIVRWAKAAGFNTTLGDDMHVTIIYSKTAVDWMKADSSNSWGGEKDDGSLRLAPGGPRVLEKFGEALVLQFASSPLCWRHESIRRDTGASSDFAEYQPHITITYDPPSDWQTFEPYRGEIILGPEVFETINDDYRATLVEDKKPWDPTLHPRVQEGPEGGEFTQGEMGVVRPPLDGLAPGSDPATISPRNITAKSKEFGNSNQEYLAIDMAALKQNPEQFSQNASLFKNRKFYPILRPNEIKGKPDEVAEHFIEAARKNLEFVYSLATPEELKARDWYHAAHAMVHATAQKYDLPDASVVAAYARMSPQKDWSQNVYLGNHLVDILKTKTNFRWDAKMEATSKAIWDTGITKKGSERDAKPEVSAAIRGKTLGQLTDNMDRAAWIRTYDEAHSDRHFEEIGVDGKPTGKLMRKKNGDPELATWQSTANIAASIRAIESNGDRIVLSDVLGAAHKIRSFYNGILDPSASNGDVTIDTHAVGAALLMPIGQSSVPVMHNFGLAPEIKDKQAGWEPTAKSAKTGVTGLYGFYAEAYRRAAANTKLSPNDFQAVTWNVKRDMMDFQGDTSRTAQTAIWDMWKDYSAGKVSLDETRKHVIDYVRAN